MHTYIIQYSDGHEIRVKAARFNYWGSNGYRFYRSDGGEDMDYDALIKGDEIVSIVPQDMIVISFEASSMLPEIVSSGRSTTDYVTDTLFSEAEKVPFSQEERQAVTVALQRASERIQEQFQTTPEQQTEIEQKLEYLSRKVKELDKFNWKRLLIMTLVGISVDLGFGTFIPSSLLGIFTEVLSHLVEKLVGRKKSLPGSA